MNSDSISIDLIMEIMLRLPQKSITRFHCVSKLWASILRGSYFRYRKSYSFFGFDPIEKQFKVLFIAYPECNDGHKIMTLGTRKMRWRTIKCPLPHEPLTEGICINGVLYYLGDCKGYVKVDVADEETSDYDYVIVCFDVRSKKFKFIYVQSIWALINYKGKLCLIYLEDDDVSWKDEVIDAFELSLWILEDAEKQEWSKYAYNLWDDKFFFVNDEYTKLDVVGVTGMGEIILSMGYYICNQPFYVFYFDPEKNTLQRVEIQGFGGFYHEAFTNQSGDDDPFSKKHEVFSFSSDHVEDLKVNDTIKHLCFKRQENKKMKKMKMKMKNKKMKMKK